MKKTFLKFGLFVVLGLTTVAFYSCDKDDDDGKDDGNKSMTITATNVVNGSDEIATVRATTWFDEKEDYYVIAETAYEDNGFSLTLPASVDAQYLDPIWDEEDEEDLGDFIVSDKATKGIILDGLDAFDEDDYDMGLLTYMNLEQTQLSANMNAATWFYVDRKVTIKGQEEYVDYDGDNNVMILDLNLKKGWNLCYITFSMSFDITTYTVTYTQKISMTKPNVSLEWHLNGLDYDSSMKSMPTKSMSTKSMLKSLFSKANR